MLFVWFIIIFTLYNDVAMAALTPNNQQCFGPDYSQPQPFVDITKNICLLAKFNSSKEESLTLQLKYGDQSLGIETFSDLNPAFSERTICQTQFPPPFYYFNNCSLCLGFNDILLAESWAKICPKYILRCTNRENKLIVNSYDEPCFQVGDDNSDDIAQIVGGNTDFAFKLLSSSSLTQDVITDAFVSPFSISNALTMTMMAANGETLEQILNSFELTKDDYNVYDSFDSLVQSLRHRSPDLISSVDNNLWINSIWYRHLSTQFLSDFDRFGTIDKCNFENQSYAETKRIDSTVENDTGGLIAQPLAKRNLSSNTVMLFTNSMYFKANWKYPLNNELSETFTDDKGDEITIHMMQSEAIKFNQYTDDKVEVIELPLQDDFSDFSWIMIRPSEQHYITDGPQSTIEFEKSLNRNLLQEWLTHMSPSSNVFQVMLPQMEMYNMQDITPSLNALGITDMFDPQMADLRNLTSAHYRVYETAINRQDYLRVTSTGIEVASVVTDGDNGHEDTNQGPVDHADRPFLFLIVDRSSIANCVILFAGRVTNPAGWKMEPNTPTNKPTHKPSTHNGNKKSSVGSIICWMIVIILIIYCMVQWCYNYFVIKLRGVESIPCIEQMRFVRSFCDDKIQNLYQMNVQGEANDERFAANLIQDDNYL